MQEKKTVKFGQVKTIGIKCWKDDSLLMPDNLFDKFYCKYSNVLNLAKIPNGTTGFYQLGINYYDKCSTERVLEELKKDNCMEYKDLIHWLEKALNKYTGFYILGL